MSSDEPTYGESETKNESSNSQEVNPDKDSDSSSSDSGDEEKETTATDNQNASEETTLHDNSSSENTSNNQDDPDQSFRRKDSSGEALKYYDDIIKKYSDDDDGDDEETDEDADKNKESDNNITKDSDAELSKVNEVIRVDTEEEEVSKDSTEGMKQYSEDNLQSISEKDDETVLTKTSHDSSSSDSEGEVNKDSIEEVKQDSENNSQFISENKYDKNVSIKTSHDSSSSDSEDEIKQDNKEKVKEDCEENEQNIANRNKKDENTIQKISQDSSSSDSEDEIKESSAGVLNKDSEISKLDQKPETNVLPSSIKEKKIIRDDTVHNKSPVRFTAHKFQDVHNTESPRKSTKNNPMASFLQKELEDQARKEQELKAAGKILTLSEDRVDERVIRGAQSVSPQAQTPVEDDKLAETPTRPQLVKTPSRLFKEMEEAAAKEKELKKQGKISTLSEERVDEKVIRTSDIGKIPAPAQPTFNVSSKRDIQVEGAQKSPKGTPIVLRGRAPKGMMQSFINSKGKMKTEGFTAPRPV